MGLCAIAACGRPIRGVRPDVEALARAQKTLAAAPALVRAGCLDCLVDAVREYDAVRNVPALAAEATAGAARTAALVALRERELGIEASGALGQSRAWADTSPALSESMALLFDVSDTLLERGDGGPVRSDAEMAAAARAARNRAAWTESLRARADENELTSYLWIAFNCAYNSPTNAEVERLLDAVPTLRDTPLIRYRIATCTALKIPELTDLFDANPRFLEIAYYKGLDGIIQGDLDEADAQFARAYAWRPRWASLANTRGNVFMTAEDFEQASAFYDQALDVSPAHVQALLGKVRALTFAGRYVDALAAADALLALERWFIGDARYYRALNELQLARYDAAWDDVERAAVLITNAEVPKLAGIIAVQRQQLGRGPREVRRGTPPQWHGLRGAVLSRERPGRAAGMGAIRRSLRRRRRLLRRVAGRHRRTDRADSRLRRAAGAPGAADRQARAAAGGPGAYARNGLVQYGRCLFQPLAPRRGPPVRRARHGRSPVRPARAGSAGAVAWRDRLRRRAVSHALTRRDTP